MSSENVVIEIRLDDGTVKKSFAKITRDSRKAGKSVGDNIGDGFVAGFGNIKGKIAAAASAFAGALFSKAAIQAAIGQENAIQRLNQSLASAGRFSEEASLQFERLGDEVERTTTVSGETFLSLAALATNFAKTNEQAQRLTRAAIELSAATGKDAASSIELLGRSLSGSAGLLSRVVPSVQSFTKEQLKSGAAIDAVLSRFSGSAASQVNTFSGAIIQSSEAFGKLLKEIGNFVIKDAGVIAFIKTVGEAFSNAANSLASFRKENESAQSIITKTILVTISFAQAVNQFFVAPIELIINGLRLAFNAGLTVINGFLFAVQKAVAVTFRTLDGFFQSVAGFISKFTGVAVEKLGSNKLFGVFNSLKEQAEIFEQSTKDVFNDSLQDTVDAYDNILNVDFAGSTALFLENLRQNVETAENIKQDFKNNVILDETTPQGLFPGLLETFQLVGSGLDTIGEKTEEAAKKIRDAAKQAGATLIQGLGAGAGSAFAAFGAAIAKGENALQAFTDQLLKTIGQASIQLGTNFILQGIAYQFAGLPNGGALIAAGAALAAFGGVLSGLGGGSGSTAEPGTPGGSPLITENQDTTVRPDQDLQEPQTSVNVVINGDVLDSDETSIRIVDLLNEAFDKKGVKIRRGAIA